MCLRLPKISREGNFSTTADRTSQVAPEQQGWHSDPWLRHEARWISGGIPSKLVRDGGLEAYDDPPDAPPSHGWVKIDTDSAAG
jgi:hypothetical protein